MDPHRIRAQSVETRTGLADKETATAALSVGLVAAAAVAAASGLAAAVAAATDEYCT